MHEKRGSFVVSLDFELFWGLTDKFTLEEYKARLDGERVVIQRMLELFDRYGIHATWATVGMMAFATKDELMKSFPSVLPEYLDKKLSAYEYLKTAKLGQNENDDPYHFGASLIREVQKHPNQEIGSHTFSHYYCVEDGQTEAAFSADLRAAHAALAHFGADATSLVLPRNQWNENYRAATVAAGVVAYRGNQNGMLYAARRDSNQNLLVRALRLLDSYIRLSGDHLADDATMASLKPFNIPASAFLRPYMPKLGFLEGLRRRRITRAMSRAAQTGRTFHLWWHPYNMGLNQEENLATLEHILNHFSYLNRTYGMQSENMGDITRRLTTNS
jgi:peptidoglycan/xylan/chitin deacetylase (PgdA/CDA1 family)